MSETKKTQSSPPQPQTPESATPGPAGIGSPAQAATVFLGDSLTAEGSWDEWFPDRRVVNLGVSGDTTEMVLERLDGVVAEAPSTVVVMIGTNDLAWRRSVEQIVGGVESILWHLHQELPDARLLVQSVLPRAEDYTDRIREINIHLRQFAPTVKAEWIDLWPAFADDRDELRADFSEDRLHLTAKGYAAWREALAAVLDRPDASDDQLTQAPASSRSNEELREGIDR